MQIFPPFTGTLLSEVKPGSIIISQAPRAETAISFCGVRQERGIPMYTIRPKGGELASEPDIENWRCPNGNLFVADLGCDYVLVVEPDALFPVEIDVPDFGPALCVREDEKYLRILTPLFEGVRAESAFLSLDTGGIAQGSAAALCRIS